MSLGLILDVEFPFQRAIEHCDNLVEVHQRSGTGTRGRRRIEISVNRAVIVIAIASWQAVVQDMTEFLLERHMPKPSEPNYGVARLIKGQVEGALGRFSTPNAENTRELLKTVGFDPRPYWTWNSGRPTSPVTLHPADVEQRLRNWLKVRHAIAHGEEKLPEVDVLQAVRQQQVSAASGPTVRLYDAKQCVSFIKKLTAVTLDGIRAEIKPPSGSP